MIKIIAIGTIKEAATKQLLYEYHKRFNKVYLPDVIELDEAKRSKNPSKSQIQESINDESNRILDRIKDRDYVILCDVEGKIISSIELSDLIIEHFNYQSNPLVFVIGGSDGVNDQVKKRANTRLSFSKMTFPHQLLRIMLFEQLYRCYTIANNITYHK
jgi:23S rRNA (pseudouridine1915-N3)-methyltransferase